MFSNCGYTSHPEMTSTTGNTIGHVATNRQSNPLHTVGITHYSFGPIALAGNDIFCAAVLKEFVTKSAEFQSSNASFLNADYTPDSLDENNGNINKLIEFLTYVFSCCRRLMMLSFCLTRLRKCITSRWYSSFILSTSVSC